MTVYRTGVKKLLKSWKISNFGVDKQKRKCYYI